MVPKARPTSHVASAQPLTICSIWSGEAEVVKSQVGDGAAQQRVADGAADEGDLVAGVVETGAQLGQHGMGRTQLVEARLLVRGQFGHKDRVYRARRSLT